MTNLIEIDLLNWIGEELLACGHIENMTKPVSLRILTMRLALASKVSKFGLSQSTELSLSQFEKIELVRLLKQLSKKNLVSFCKNDGTEISEQESKDISFQVLNSKENSFIKFTDLGKEEYKRILSKHN